MTIEVAVVPIIITVVYFIIEILKVATKNNTKVLSLIPLFSAVFGAILGIVSFYFIPTIMPTTELFWAIIIGAVSGLSATGTNQIFKQLSKFGIDIKIKNEDGINKNNSGDNNK